MPATSLPSSQRAIIQKRQRDAEDNQLYYPQLKTQKTDQLGRSQNPALFLPTHLVILQALYDADEYVSNSCPHPRWAEVNRFVQLQSSIAQGARQSRRISGLLRVLGGVSPETLTQSSRSTTIMESRRMIPQHNLPTLQRNSAEEVGGVRTESSTSYTTSGSPAYARALPNESGLDNFTLDPRSVVCAVLRRGLRDREDKYNSVVSEELRNGVDHTVENLASSMERLIRQQEDMEIPWHVRGTPSDELNAAEVIERHANKLLLWRRLQSALSAYREMAEVGKKISLATYNRATRP